MNSLRGEVRSRATDGFAELVCSQVLLCAIGNEENPLGVGEKKERKKKKFNVEIRMVWVDPAWTPKCPSELPCHPNPELGRAGTSQLGSAAPASSGAGLLTFLPCSSVGNLPQETALHELL